MPAKSKDQSISQGRCQLQSLQPPNLAPQTKVRVMVAALPLANSEPKKIGPPLARRWLSGHCDRAQRCLLSEVKRTWTLTRPTFRSEMWYSHRNRVDRHALGATGRSH